MWVVSSNVGLLMRLARKLCARNAARSTQAITKKIQGARCSSGIRNHRSILPSVNLIPSRFHEGPQETRRRAAGKPTFAWLPKPGAAYAAMAGGAGALGRHAAGLLELIQRRLHV